jgi:hypothetical protein
MQFQKRPIVIEAVRWTGANLEEVVRWCEGLPAVAKALPTKLSFDLARPPVIVPTITTLEGVMVVSEGDWIICGVNGELYPCKPDIFLKGYDPVGDEAAEAYRACAETERSRG